MITDRAMKGENGPVITIGKVGKLRRARNIIHRITDEVRIPRELIYEGYQMITFDLMGSVKNLTN